MNSPSDLLTSYVRAFETLRGEAVVPFYDLPCTFIRPDGVWVVQDEATGLVLANHMIDQAKGQGYHRTEIAELNERSLAANLVELNGTFVRYDKANTQIGRFGFTYTLRYASDTWKIVVAVAHDA